MKIFLFTVFTLLLSPSFYAQVSGCTDLLSQNYNALATVNDGSCSYAASVVSPLLSVSLPDVVSETSGLIQIDGLVYTLNDNADTNLYGIDPASGAVIQTITLPGVTNTDWEEIAHDEDYIYIGDFGNNLSGNRTDLKIIRVVKSSLTSATPVTDVINFSYADQTNLAPAPPNQTDFDCEAMIIGDDAVYLFTKQWVSQGSTVYVIPKTPGNHIATPAGTLNAGGLITGATHLKDKNLVVLCGYSTMLQPFFYILYDFNGNDFFSGNKRKVTLSLPYHQTEGITTTDGLSYYVSNESFIQQPVANNPQKLHTFNLAPYLGYYLLEDILSNESVLPLISRIILYPNPAQDVVTIEIGTNNYKTNYSVTDVLGREVASGWLYSERTQVNVSYLPAGIYNVSIGKKTHLKLIKK